MLTKHKAEYPTKYIMNAKYRNVVNNLLNVEFHQNICKPLIMEGILKTNIKHAMLCSTKAGMLTNLSAFELI